MVTSSMEPDHALLAAHGLKRTAPRLAVLRTLRAASHPMSVQEVGAEIKRVADQVTVYRTIQAFLEKGIVREVNLRHAHADYELASADDHHHIVCTQCGMVNDFDVCDVEPLVKQVLKQCPSFARVDEHAIELFGVCRACAAVGKRKHQPR